MIKKNEHRRTIAICQGCGLKFYAARKDTLFCHRRCYERNRSSVYRNPKMGSREIPMTSEIVDFRESVLKAASYHAEYYTATNVDLQLAFPLPGETVRSTGLTAKMPFYRLEPFEFPMVPLEGLYTIHYFTKLGLSVPPHERKAAPELLISFTHPLKRTVPAEIQAGVKQFLIDRTSRLTLPTPKNKRLGLPQRKDLAAVRGQGGPIAAVPEMDGASMDDDEPGA